MHCHTHVPCRVSISCDRVTCENAGSLQLNKDGWMDGWTDFFTHLKSYRNVFHNCVMSFMSLYIMSVCRVWVLYLQAEGYRYNSIIWHTAAAGPPIKAPNPPLQGPFAPADPALSPPNSHLFKRLRASRRVRCEFLHKNELSLLYCYIGCKLIIFTFSYLVEHRQKDILAKNSDK